MSNRAEAEARESLAQFHARYVNDCRLFVVEMLSVVPHDWQGAVADDLSAGTKLISIRSARGRGKTAVVALIVLWWMLTRFPQKTVVTAPAASTITDGIWPEIHLWANRLPVPLRSLFEITADRIVIGAAPAESFVTAKTAREDRPEALQGIHAEHVLIIVDEASGASERAMEALTGSLAGNDRRMILISNGTRTSGFFYSTQRGEYAEQWSRYQISALPIEAPEPGVKAFHCPVPGDEAFIAGMRARYGAESSAFRVHVRGEFPKADDDTVIPLHLVEDARRRDIDPSEVLAPIWGVDVARFGSDSSVLCKRRGNAVTEPLKRWRNYDTMQVAGAVKMEFDTCDPRDRPSEILVDLIGIGAGVVDRLRELGLPVRGINVAESPAMKGQYLNLRAELWFKAKAWFEQRGCRLPDDEELCAELVTVKYGFSERGNLWKVESKDDMKKRGMASPDKADAFVLTFASEAVAGAAGSWSTGWNRQVRRGLTIV